MIKLWPLKNLFSNFTGLLLILFYIVHIRALGGDPMISKKNIKLGAPGLNKNPFLNPDGGLNLVEKFPGIDFIPYEKKKIKKRKKR